MLEEFLPFVGLIIFGNIENLVLASNGVVAGVNSKVLAILSIICVIIWLVVGTLFTNMLLQYALLIDFIGGLAIFILGIKSMVSAIRGGE